MPTYYDYLDASDGTGDAALMHISADRLTGATTIHVDTVAEVPAKFIGTYGTLLASGYIDPATKRDFRGHLDAGNIEIDGFEAGNVDAGNVEGQVIVIKPSTGWSNKVASFIKNITGFGTPEPLHGSTGTFSGLVTAAGFVATGLGSDNGWTIGAIVPTSITHLGQRSYSVVYNGIDLRTIHSPGMRQRFTRTTAAPGQCASLNGTSQYFNRSTTITGVTFTDDFVVSAWIKLGAYTGSGQVILSRYNGISGFSFRVGANAQIILEAYNASASNSSNVTSSQSIPVGRWVHVTAQLDMSSFTATPTTSYVMIDGVDVPATVARVGTNPTALIQAGNIEVGSSNGGGSPFSGKIVQGAIYSAKVTQANIRATISQGLAGTETSLAAAYSLSNSVNDLTSNGNNLTAQGSALTTAVDAPWTQDGTGTPTTNIDCAIVEALSYAGSNTTEIVQVPEGCTLPTTGTIAAAAYAPGGTPYGFPAQKGKWRLVSLLIAQLTQGSAASGTWYNPGAHQINAPAGEWIGGYQNSSGVANSSGTIVSYNSLSSSASAESNSEFTTETYFGSNQTWFTPRYRASSLSPAAATPYYLIMKYVGASTATLYAIETAAPSMIFLDNSYV